ncbi:hypothetical protein [Streptomyces xanthochromogenes]|uniref:hypothetical protein n=1 Tax=Streptomyces xanthochromogenes TaxID=67384 RepID=UPI003571551F
MSCPGIPGDDGALRGRRHPSWRLFAPVGRWLEVFVPGNSRESSGSSVRLSVRVARNRGGTRGGERGVGAPRVGRMTGMSVEQQPLWVEEPAVRPRLPDPVRTAAVRAVIIVAATLMQAMVAFLSALAGSWLAFPMVLSSVGSTVLATWGVLDVWVTRQVWNQRNGVVSIPSSTARKLRKERRRARRAARAGERGARIRSTDGSGQRLSRA